MTVEIPQKSRCPSCGAKPTEESVREEILSDLGYHHRDVMLKCTECAAEWAHGIPLGEYDGGEDLVCPCGETMLVHRVHVAPGMFKVFLDLKCPDEVCHHWRTGVEREMDTKNRVALVGYKEITGSVDGARPLGWNPPEDEGSGR